LVSEDTEGALKYLNTSHPNIKTFRVLDSESKTAMRDLGLLLQSRGIIQHCTSGWSSFSAFPAMIRNIPLMQTYVANPNNMEWDWTFLDMFAKYGPEMPEEFFSCRPGRYNVFANESITRFRKWVVEGRQNAILSGYWGDGAPVNWNEAG
jgi:hypothetical protein